MNDGRMSAYEIAAALDAIAVQAERAGIRVTFDTDMKWGDGKSNIGNGREASCVIGVKWPYDDSVTDMIGCEAIKPIVAAYHEIFGHIGRARGEIRSSEATTRAVGLRYYACLASAPYYFGGEYTGDDDSKGQYFRHLHEIEAEHIGTLATYRLLGKMYGSDFAAEAVIGYAENKAKSGSSCLAEDSSFAGISELSEAYAKAFKDSLSNGAAYVLPEGSLDLATQYLCNCGCDAREVASSISSMTSDNRDLYLSMIYMRTHPNEKVIGPAIGIYVGRITDNELSLEGNTARGAAALPLDGGLSFGMKRSIGKAARKAKPRKSEPYNRKPTEVLRSLSLKHEPSRSDKGPNLGE